MKFEKFDKVEQGLLAGFFRNQMLHMGDFSQAFQFMWYDALKPTYAIAAGCLVLREFYEGKHYFHYPISTIGSKEEEMQAVECIEAYCRENYVHLNFTNVPKSRVAELVSRYGASEVVNDRHWRDYLYDAESFKMYAGKKYAGQRNHVRKFEKLYPDWSFSEALPSDMGGVNAFLHEYEAVQREKHDFIAEEEMDEVYALLPHIARFGLYAGILKVGDKIVGFSVGERCGDMIIVHIEKALRGYEGAYPFLAQQFAKRFCGDGVRFLNRMDDAGDLGLRKSKLQYGPSEIVDKFNVSPQRAVDRAHSLPVVHTERLTLKAVRDEDAERYRRLAADKGRNRYWGEVWGLPQDDEPRSAEFYLNLARRSFEKRMEMPLGIYLGEELVGEVLLHSFGYAAEAEIGVRLLPEYEGNGYAAEAVRGYTDHAFSWYNLETVEARCYKENARSRAMLLSAGMRETGADENYYFFKRTPVM